MRFRSGKGVLEHDLERTRECVLTILANQAADRVPVNYSANPSIDHWLKIVHPVFFGPVAKPRFWQDDVQENGRSEMATKRRKHSEAVKGVRTLSAWSSRFTVHPAAIAHGKRMLIEGVPGVFGGGNGGLPKSEEELTAPLHERIGRLQMEVDWLKESGADAEDATANGSAGAAYQPPAPAPSGLSLSAAGSADWHAERSLVCGITYVPMRRGFLCVVAIEEFTARLEVALARVSMDGRVRVTDSIFIERLWRSVKYGAVYRRDYADGAEARRGLERYVRFYNTQRRHQALGNRTPRDVPMARAA